MEKDYSLKIDEAGNVSFHFDEECGDYYGTPIGMSSTTSFQLKPGAKDQPGTFIKTTVVRETYQLKTREIKKEDILFALNIIGEQKSVLNIDLPYSDKLMTPGIISEIRIAKLKDKERELYKMTIDLAYDEYYEGQLNAKTVKEHTTFIVTNKELSDIYMQLCTATRIKEALRILEAIKSVMRNCLIPEESYSVKPEHELITKDITIEEQAIIH